MDFICSTVHLIGEVIYFWRREYQDRSIQHFHLLFWISMETILEKCTNY